VAISLETITAATACWQQHLPLGKIHDGLLVENMDISMSPGALHTLFDKTSAPVTQISAFQHATLCMIAAAGLQTRHLMSNVLSQIHDILLKKINVLTFP